MTDSTKTMVYPPLAEPLPTDTPVGKVQVMPQLLALLTDAGLKVKKDYYGYVEKESWPKSIKRLSKKKLAAAQAALMSFAENLEPLSAKHQDPDPKRTVRSLVTPHNIPRLGLEVEKVIEQIERSCITLASTEALHVLIKKGWGPYLFHFEIGDYRPLSDLANLGPKGFEFLDFLNQNGYSFDPFYYSDSAPLVRAAADQNQTAMVYFLDRMKADAKHRGEVSESAKAVLASFSDKLYTKHHEEQHQDPTSFFSKARTIMLEHVDLFAQSHDARKIFEHAGSAIGSALGHGDLELAEKLLASPKAYLPSDALARAGFMAFPRQSAELLVRYGASMDSKNFRDSNPLMSALFDEEAMKPDSLMHYLLALGVNPREKNEEGGTVIGAALGRWPLSELKKTFKVTPDDVLSSTIRSSYDGEGNIPSLLGAFKKGSSATRDGELEPALLELFDFVKDHPDFPAFCNEKALSYAINSGLPLVFSELLTQIDKHATKVNTLKLVRAFSYHPYGREEDRNRCLSLLLQHPAFQSEALEAAKLKELRELFHKTASQTDTHPDYIKQNEDYYGRARVLIENGTDPFKLHSINSTVYESDEDVLQRKAHEEAKTPLWELPEWKAAPKRFKEHAMELLSLAEAIQLRDSLSTLTKSQKTKTVKSTLRI